MLLLAAGRTGARNGSACVGLRITRLETFLVKPRWLFLKVHTSAGIVGLGEPIVEGRAETVQTAVRSDPSMRRSMGPKQSFVMARGEEVFQTGARKT